jgi:hypothetical protein
MACAFASRGMVGARPVGSARPCLLPVAVLRINPN